jgi:hypothetical protein
MWSLGMEGGAAHRNWTTPVAPLAGEGVGKVEGLTNRRFVAADGWGAPMDGRPAAPREPGHGAPISGVLPVWDGHGWRGEIVETMWSCEGGTGLRRHELEEGVLGSAHTDRPPACSGLYRRARQRDAPP